MIKRQGHFRSNLAAHFLLGLSPVGLIFLFTLGLLPFTWPAKATISGSLDPDFGEAQGIVTTKIGQHTSATGIAIQPDGKIVVSGNSDGKFMVARYISDGTLDGNFSGDGIVTTTIGILDTPSGMVLQADGKIVVIGFSDGRFALARYHQDGSLDNSFDGDGIVTTIIDNYAGAYGVALQSNGKIVVAGSSDGRFALARYHDNGSLDNQFGNSGLVTTSINVEAYGRDVAIQPDGKIIVAGSSRHGGERNEQTFTLTRYHHDGSLDNSFGNQGVVNTFIKTHWTGASYAGINAIAIQPDNKIVAVGWCALNIDPFEVLTRYTPNGQLDTSLPNGGVVPAYTGGHSDVVVQPDSKIVVAGSSIGYTSVPETADITLIRYNGNGSGDFWFGDNGRVITQVDWTTKAGAVTLQSDGKIVIAGSATNEPQNQTLLVVARYIGDDPNIQEAYLPLIQKN